MAQVPSLAVDFNTQTISTLKPGHCRRVTLRTLVGQGIGVVQRSEEPRNKNSKRKTKPGQITNTIQAY